MVGRQRTKLFTWAVLLAITLLIAGEVAARALRLCDVPLFDADPRIGYIPNQSGAWRWSNQWAFNALHMGTARPFAPSPSRPDVLLIGDSIVSGGVHYREEQRFGPSLARATGLTVCRSRRRAGGCRTSCNICATIRRCCARSTVS